MELQKRLGQIQFGIFFSPLLDRPDKLTFAVLEQFGEVFDGLPLSLPLPANVTFDDKAIALPISNLQSSNNVWKLYINRIRADIIYSPDVVDSAKNDYAEITEELKTMRNIILLCADEARKRDVYVNRITNIIQYVVTMSRPYNFVAEKLLKNPIEKAREISIRINEPGIEDGLSIHNITSIEAAPFKRDGKMTGEEGILLLKDVNTKESEGITFSNKEIEKFLDASQTLLAWDSVVKYIS